MAFLAFEGIDGCGKSTLISRLEVFLRKMGVDVYLTREPGGTPLAEELREIIIRKGEEIPHSRTELLLYEAARAQHVECVIKPHLKKGTWVLSDRFTASSLAFQCGGRSIDEQIVNWLNEYAVDGCTPDLNVLLDLDIHEAHSRRLLRTQNGGLEFDRFELEKEAFHQRVRDHYLKQAQKDPKHWIVLDASASPEIIFDNLITELRTRSWLV